jgi:hypothetical protein
VPESRQDRSRQDWGRAADTLRQEGRASAPFGGFKQPGFIKTIWTAYR